MPFEETTTFCPLRQRNFSNISFGRETTAEYFPRLIILRMAMVRLLHHKWFDKTHHKWFDGFTTSIIYLVYIKRYLGFKTFLAHDDLSISDDWPPKILEKLKETDFVIPLLSNNFLCSGFANQEVGIALAKNKKIIPVSIDGRDPTGFIYHIHAHKCRE